MRMLENLFTEEDKDRCTNKLLKILLDPENTYNLLYLAVSITALLTHPLVYSILLLDIIKRSEDL